MRTTLGTLSYNLENINSAANEFWKIAGMHKILAFSGEMGAGKTTFIHHLCERLKVEDTVSSPTFALINEYHFNNASVDTIIYHMDWYRLKDAGEAIDTGMEDAILQAGRGGAYCFIEWPEKAMELLPKSYIWLNIRLTDMHNREMEIILVS